MIGHLLQFDVGAAIQGALDAQHDEDTMLMAIGIDNPNALQRRIARIYARGMTAELRQERILLRHGG